MQKDWVSSVFRAFLASLCLLSLPAAATGVAAGPEALPVYPNASLTLKESRMARDYPLLSSRVSKIRGKIRSTDAQWLNGQLERRIYELPTGRSSADGFRFIQEELGKLGAQDIFSCTGRDCGQSNLWANDIFQVANLYGREREQSYLLAKSAEGGSYWLAYAVTRGTNRTYLLIDYFTPDTP
ncbi:DUF4892 domain-containing protein [Parendozoicomonas haliclonae]|uniref:DUF4892 domain-containing protein n=1 Tax=Parendozoicomonas haliclonae TaxID=1960125 RepID=A0A1X7AKP6_9GAMM|nr:DUF4892 domain-containing protein [Parendozoicomonas haliclonae]SMA47411.1 hypothetical protein EHSB41UT_02409 [Parendozoicomonas haliclonae]